MKDDFNAVTELMTEHRPMFAASLAEAVLFGGYLCWKNPLVGICLILISLLQVIPPLLVKKYIQVNYDKCREIEGKITDYTVSRISGLYDDQASIGSRTGGFRIWKSCFRHIYKNRKQLDLLPTVRKPVCMRFWITS